MIRFFNEIKTSIQTQMTENYEEIKEAFDKKLIQFFLPKAILDLEKVFKVSQDKMDLCFLENMSKMEEKFSRILFLFKALNQKILHNY